MLNKLIGYSDNAAAHGGEVDFLLELCHWFVLLLFIGWTAYFVYVLYRFRKTKNPKADHVGVTSPFSGYLEIGVVIFEAILLLGFALPLWAKRVNDPPDEKKSIVVRVVAQQFVWNIHYPGPDGVFGKQNPKLVADDNLLGLSSEDAHAKDDVVSLNIMHLPVHKPVIVQITSKDVIHCFKVIQMRTTQDAIPGMIIPAWFTPEKMGTYEIVCAQLCGNSHYKMKGTLIVDSEQDYNNWLKSQPAFGVE